MMSSDVFSPGDEHRDEVIELMRVAFNMGTGSLVERAAWLPVEKMRCVLDGDRIVAAAAAHDFRQWWGGRELEMSGIWGVVTLPEHQGGGLATRAVTELLVDARARGRSLSALYPATQRPFRGAGRGGWWRTVRVRCRCRRLIGGRIGFGRSRSGRLRRSTAARFRRRTR